jgi:cell division protein FtsQ
MVRRSSTAAAASDDVAGRIYKALRHTLALLLVLLAIVAGAALFSYVEQFLITDRRFILEGPPEPGEKSSNFRLEGLHYTSEQQIIHVFGRDFGRSLYLCPIKDRRLRLLAIDWVKDAAVLRIWPNQILVRITERQPVAFVQLPVADGTMRYGLVDGDGVMLNPQRPRQLKLPVLTGVPATDTEERRRERVRRFLRMQQDLGPALMKNISEINVSDPDNLKVTQVIDGRAMVLVLGSRDFRIRLDDFLKNYAEIRKRLPGAMVLDLRLRGRITALGGTSDGR